MDYERPIQFDNSDFGDVRFPHDDPIVLSLKVGTRKVGQFAELAFKMNRILVDTGSSVDILYKQAFDDLGFTSSDLSPIRTPLERRLRKEEEKIQQPY